jgi:hypothetical protein
VTDGITTTDWDRIHQLSVDVMNAAAADEERARARDLLRALDELEYRYGPVPTILATRGDYLEDAGEAITSLLRAWDGFSERGDRQNQFWVATSIVDRYVELNDAANASGWLEIAREHANPDSRYDRAELGWASGAVQRLMSS